MATEQFILLPEHSFRVPVSNRRAFDIASDMHAASIARRPMRLAFPGVAPQAINIVDSVTNDGPKLVELDTGSNAALRVRQMGMRLEPLRYYQPAVNTAFNPDPAPDASALPPVTVRVVSAQDGSGLAGAVLTVFTDFPNNVGATGTTGKNGDVALSLGTPPVAVDRWFVTPPPGFWGSFRTATSLSHGGQIALTPVTLPYPDALRHYYPHATKTDGQGIRVAVVDTGIDATHQDLVVTDGRNAVTGETNGDYGDNGIGHGTHVAGIIAAQGKQLMGLAPGVELWSFRVFGKNTWTATNYAIIKALWLAADHECDLANISVAGLPTDDAMSEALDDAMNHGMVVVSASGNDGRKEVAYPARYDKGLGVSAIGRKGTYPAGSREEGDVQAQPSSTKDPDNYVAGFSNIGSAIALAAPGVGILSTLPGQKYGPMSGTSMAAPAATGALARLLSQNADIRKMPRDIERARAIINFGNRSAVDLGFPLFYQGSGLLP
jgi:subtilisin